MICCGRPSTGSSNRERPRAEGTCNRAQKAAVSSRSFAFLSADSAQKTFLHYYFFNYLKPIPSPQQFCAQHKLIFQIISNTKCLQPVCMVMRATVPWPPGYMQRKAFPSSSAWIFPAGVSSPPHLSISTSEGSESFDKLATESWLTAVTSWPFPFLSAGSAQKTFLNYFLLNFQSAYNDTNILEHDFSSR